MKTQRLLQVLSMATLCLLATSCFDATNPLSDPAKSQADQRLAGVWRMKDDAGAVTYYHFGRVADKLPKSVMRVAGIQHKPDGMMEQFGELLLFPTTIGDKTYLNVCDGKEPQRKLLEEKGWRPETVNAYLILRYQVAGEVLTIQCIDGEAKKRAIEAGRIKGVIERKQDGFNRVMFTDTSENLAKLVAEMGDDLFSKDVIRLERVK